MRLRELHVGCLGGGTGLPSLLGGLKANPWLQVHAIVTMFDSGGSSGVLRDELGVLPPGDVLKCALALARDEGEARRVLLTRLPTLEHRRLGGHTGGNLLLSMMEQFSGDFQAAVDGLRAVLGCRGYVWPISTERASLCAEYADGGTTTGEVEVDAGQLEGRPVRRVWLSPSVVIHPAARDALGRADVEGVRDAVAQVQGPVVLVANLLTEGRGMADFTAADAVRHISSVLGRPVDTVLFNAARPGRDVLDRYAAEHKHPLALGDMPHETEVVQAPFWHGPIARHHRRRLAYAMWGVLARRLL
jgi:2-phospho-L-lactate transferase/gluconeogenesis factor (CofD/UPF0052 family)